MNRPIVYVLALILLAWLIGMGWCHSSTCPDCQTATATVAPPLKSNAALAIDIEDKDLAYAANTNDNLLFEKGACEYQSPLSDRLQTVFQNTVNHLQNNVNRILVLTGLYESTENNNCTEAADLGIARAEKVRDLLILMGAPSDRIELEASAIRDLSEYENNLVIGGVDYAFKEFVVEDALRADKIILYFDTNKQEINLTDEQRIYFERLKAFLAQNPDAKAAVTGHTDDRGNDRGNLRLSRKRSEFVRDYMKDQGIPRKQIVNKGLGPDQPIATNDTEEGRALNRRVEITLQ